MKLQKRFFCAAFTSALALIGCAVPSVYADEASDASDYFSNRDFRTDYEENECVAVTLEEDSISCDSDAVSVSGTTATITDEGTYLLSGTLDDGMIIVDAEKTDKIQLILDNVTIHSETSAPVYIRQADKVFLTSAKDSTNTLSNGGSFTAVDENNIDAVIFSKEDLTLNGSGTVIITSPAGHGIVSKDSLRLTGGSYDINCASHALNGKDEVCIADASFTIVSGKDGIHAENSDEEECGYVYIQSGEFDIASEGDGISAGAYLLIEDGDFRITAGGGSENAEEKASDSWGQFMGGGMHGGGRGGMGAMEMDQSSANTADTDEESTSMKGVKAASELSIYGGTFTINSADDSIHSNTSITIEGGEFDIASGDDGFHADDTLNVTNGTIRISESYEGLEALHLTISGGDITLEASDDGLNAAGGTDESGITGGRDGMFGGGMFGGQMSSNSDGTIVISGGVISITAYGDGIDANGSVEITGGEIYVCGPNQGDTSTLDYDTTATISGGIFIGTGASGMAQTFSDSEQGVIAVRTEETSAGTEVILTDSNGNTVISCTPDLPYSVIILSSPDIVKGETYTLTAGDNSKEFTAS